MATFRSPLMAPLDEIPEGISVPDAGGRVRLVDTTFTFTGNELDGDDVQMARLPTGAKLLWIKHATTALGAGATLDIGDGADDNRYVTADDVSSATQAGVDGLDVAGSAAVLPRIIAAGQEVITFTFDDVGAPTTADSTRLMALYVMD